MYIVEMYYGGELPDEIRKTSDMSVANQWANECEHAVIVKVN